MMKVKRVLALLLCLALLLTYAPMRSLAAEGTPNIEMSIDREEVQPGDTITVVLRYNDMTVKSFGAYIQFDLDKLTCTSVTGGRTRPESVKNIGYLKDIYGDWVKATSMSNTDKANSNGQVGFAYGSTEDWDYEGGILFTATFVVKDDATGTLTFGTFEDSNGPDGYQNKDANGENIAIETQTVTIIGSTEPAPPECEHTETALVRNPNGTHTVVCTNETCNGYVVKIENCSGTDDGDHTTAVTCACGNIVTAATEHTYTQNRRGSLMDAGDCENAAVYYVLCDNCDYENKSLTVDGEKGDHNYGELIEATEEVHDKETLAPSVDAHYYCPECETYFTEEKIETTIGDLTGTTPVHTEDPNLTTSVTNPSASCTEEGKTVTETFCSCGYKLSHTETTIPAGTGCDLADPTYNWSGDYATCTAEVKCQNETVHKAETVNTTSKVTTVADCQTAEVVTYTADFTSDWAEDQTEEVTGNINRNKHVGTPTVSYRQNGNSTHSEIFTYECGHSVDGATTDCADGDDADELCDACGNNLHVHTHDLYDYINYESHEIFCDCGETLGVVAHELGEDGSCVCGAIELRVGFEFADFEGNDDPIEGHEQRSFWVMPNQDLILNVSPTNGYGYVSYYIADWDDESDDAPYEAGIIDEQFKVSTDWYDAEWLYISVMGVSCQTIDLNGGSVVNPDDWGEDYDPEENVIFLYGNETGYWKLSWYTEESEEIVREGYKLIGFMRDGKFHDVNEEIYGKAGDETLTLVWECNHDADIHDYSYTYVDSSTHTVECECSETIATVAHEHGEDGSCVCGAFLVTMDYNGGADKLNPGEPSDSWYTMEHTLQWNDEFCKDVYTKDGYVFAGFASDAAGENLLPYGTVFQSSTTFYVVWECNHDEAFHEYSYIDNNDGTHTVKCACGKILKTTESHDYTTGDADHTCACKAVEKFTVTWTVNGEKYDETTFEYGAAVEAPEYVVSEGYTFCGWDVPATMPAENLTINATLTANEYTLTVNVWATGDSVELTVPYGANLLDVLAAAEAAYEIPALDESIRVNNANQNGEISPYQYIYSVGEAGDLSWPVIDENTTMPAKNFEIYQDYNQNGWVFTDLGDGRVGAEYCDLEDGYLTGWNYIEEDYDGVDGGAWYYFYEGTGDWEDWYFRAEGLTRAPYPVDDEGNPITINGNTYAPDADAVASDPDFIDATEAWFMFGDDGKFQYDARGIVDNSKLVNGMLAWHPGMVEIPGSSSYHYFLGNEENGGNIGANGDVWVTRIAEDLDREFVLGGIYTFEDSKLCEYTGITKVGGKLRFYGSEGADENRLMAGNGLTKVGENFIYVRSNGELVVNADYYVPTNNKGIVPGTYHFDKNGFLVNPELTTKNGIVAENGGLFFYENGKIAYNKGLIQYNGGIIYVRSNGQLAVGEYYVTNLANFNGNDVKYGDKVTFGDDGYMVAAKNGIVDGLYYIDNQIAYNAGVVQLENGKYIYVKSNGTVVMNTNYWITNVGDTGVVAKLYSFDANGYFTPEFAADQKDGIVDGYYYVDGKIAYGAGLIYLEDEGCYIYVRSNGQLATGIYWPTATNGYDFSGRYDFGADGKLYI